MGLLTGIPTWSFDGVSFVLRASDEWDVAHAEEAIVKIDPILDGSRYVDVGGVTYDPLTRVAAFETEVARNALAAKRGQDGTLTNIQGVSWTALLRRVRKLNLAGGIYLLECTWERV